MNFTYDRWLNTPHDGPGLPVMMADGHMGLLIRGTPARASIQVYRGNAAEENTRDVPWDRLFDLGGGALIEGEERA